MIRKNVDNDIEITLTEKEFIDISKKALAGIPNTSAMTLAGYINYTSQLGIELFHTVTPDELKKIIDEKNNIIYDNKLGIIYGELGTKTNLVLNGEQLYVGDIVGYFNKKKKKEGHINSIVCEQDGQFFLFGIKTRCLNHEGDLSTLKYNLKLKKLKSWDDKDNDYKIYDERIAVKKEEK